MKITVEGEAREIAELVQELTNRLEPEKSEEMEADEELRKWIL